MLAQNKAHKKKNVCVSIYMSSGSRPRFYAAKTPQYNGAPLKNYRSPSFADIKSYSNSSHGNIMLSVDGKQLRGGLENLH